MKSPRAKMCIAKAKGNWGDGWLRLSPELREALVSRELVLLALAQCEDTRKQYPSEVLENLLADFREALQQLGGGDGKWY